MEQFDIPNDMDIPELRREKNIENARWILRNIGIRNSRHPEFHKTLEKIRKFIIKRA